MLTLVIAAALTTSTAGASCDIRSVCLDTVLGFAGEVIFDGVRLDWSNGGEPGDVDYFVLLRSDCANSSACAVQVAVIPAAGTCGQPQAYSYVDDPPGPVSAWTYTVEVWKADGSRACAIDDSLASGGPQ